MLPRRARFNYKHDLGKKKGRRSFTPAALQVVAPQVGVRDPLGMSRVLAEFLILLTNSHIRRFTFCTTFRLSTQVKRGCGQMRQ